MIEKQVVLTIDATHTTDRIFGPIIGFEDEHGVEDLNNEWGEVLATQEGSLSFTNISGHIIILPRRRVIAASIMDVETLRKELQENKEKTDGE